MQAKIHLNMVDDSELIEALYARGFSSEDIAKLYKTTKQVVCKYLSRLDITRRNSSDASRVYDLNQNYFNKIDTPRAAYWLGLLYADGNVRFLTKTTGRVKIDLQVDDKYILDEFNKDIRSADSTYTIKVYKNNNGIKDIASLVFTSKTMCDDLVRLGCFERKSATLQLPNNTQVPDELFYHFLRGFFDGDGCISLDRRQGLRATVGFTSNIKLLTQLKDKLIGLRGSISQRKPNYGSLLYHSQHSVTQLYNNMYKDCGNLFLTRKKNKFDEYIAFKRMQYTASIANVDVVSR